MLRNKSEQRTDRWSEVVVLVLCSRCVTDKSVIYCTIYNPRCVVTSTNQNVMYSMRHSSSSASRITNHDWFTLQPRVTVTVTVTELFLLRSFQRNALEQILLQANDSLRVNATLLGSKKQFLSLASISFQNLHQFERKNPLSSCVCALLASLRSVVWSPIRTETFALLIPYLQTKSFRYHSRIVLK